MEYRKVERSTYEETKNDANLASIGQGNLPLGFKLVFAIGEADAEGLLESGLGVEGSHDLKHCLNP